MRFYFKLEVTEGNVRIREYFSADFSPFYYNNVIFPKFGSDLFLKFRDSKPQNPEDSWRPESKDICRISSVLSAWLRICIGAWTVQIFLFLFRYVHDQTIFDNLFIFSLFSFSSLFSRVSFSSTCFSFSFTLFLHH